MQIGEFKVEASDGEARAGRLMTAHGEIETPVFMPVGTKASVKALDPAVVEQLGAQIILGNTYHLYLAPGHELIRDMGGLHHFMHWDKPILTDSGGFQVFSLGAGKKARSQMSDVREQEEIIPEAKITEEGVEFRSHKDGSTHFLTPEKSMEIQADLGADIIMAFDECPPYPSTVQYYKQSMDRTHRWLDRSVTRKSELEHVAGANRTTSPKEQLLFGIVQGGLVKHYREQSAHYVVEKDLPGIAIGGVANGGEDKALQKQQVEWVVPHLPKDKPRYLMGIGTPLDLVEFIALGIDMFDCVLPTRLARNGAVWIVEHETRGMKHEARGKRIQIKNAQFKYDPRSLSEDCQCSTCTRFSRAYIHHLFMENEPLGMQLTSLHNLHVLLDEMRQIRAAIQNGTFTQLKQEIRTIWGEEQS